MASRAAMPLHARDQPQAMPDEVEIPVAEGIVRGSLAVPPHPFGLVVFAHGSGSSRFSPRNQAVARVLQERGLATLLMDLLTAEEDEVDQRTRALRFDIPRLAKRLVAITRWARSTPPTGGLRVGLFGSSTGAAAALVAAAQLPRDVHAVVSRGGRPDLAGDALPRVEAPTLLIVGSRDEDVLRLNEDARARMRARVEPCVIPGATHLFEEEGALEAVAEAAASFFARELADGLARPPSREPF